VAVKAQNGIFSGIFTDDVFDFDKAYAIAVCKTTYKGKETNLKHGNKLKYLQLPEFIQERLSVLKTRTVAKRQSREKKKVEDYHQKIVDLKVQAEDIKYKLELHAEKSSSRMTMINQHANVWIASKLCSDSIIGGMKEYEKITDLSIKRETFKANKNKLKDLGLL
jgi:hypothetical protein